MATNEGVDRTSEKYANLIKERMLKYMSLKKIVSVLLILIMVIPTSIGVFAEEMERQITIFSDTFEDTKAADWKVENGSWRTQEALGRVLLEDNFDDGDASDWNGYKGTWNVQQNQGGYQYVGSDSNITAMSTKGELTWTNYVMEQKVTMLSDINTGGPVLLFRYVDNSNYYRISINKSYIELIRTKNGVQKWLTTKQYKNLKQNVSFDTKITVVGNTIEFYIDGNKMLSFTETDANVIPAGKIGLGSYRSTSSFDNVKVTEKMPVGNWFSQQSIDGGTATAGYTEWTDYNMKSSVYMLKTGEFSGINLRYRDTANMYSLVGDGSTIKIEKAVNGIKTTLAEKAFNLQAGTGYNFEGRINGGNIEFLIDGTPQLTAQDGDLLSGKVGLTAGSDMINFDNVEIKRNYTPYSGIVSAGNTNYYVSASEGNDNNNGLSPQTPWKSLLKVSSVTFAPGDTIHLKAGDLWDEMYDADFDKPGTESYGVMLKGSGTKDNPITLTRYGEGKRPIIRSAARAIVYGKNVSGWTVKDLELFVITNGFLTDWNKLGVGVNIRVESDKAPISDIIIDNNEIYGIDYNHCSRGIVLSTSCYTQTTDIQAKGVTISNNNIHDVGWVGISSAAWDAQMGKEYFYQGLFDNVLITMNNVYNTANNGILMSSMINSEISRNVVHHGGQYKGNDLTWTPGGIWPISSKNVVMKFNEASFMEDSGTGWDGTGLNIDWNNTGVTMIYNYTHDNVGPGITTMAVNDCKIISNKVERNASRIDELGQIMVGDFSGRPDLMTGVKNTEVSYNTVIHGLANKPAIQYRHVTEGDSWYGNTILNNNVVMVGAAKTGMTVELRPSTVADAVYRNRYYLEDGISFVADKFGTKYNFGDWQNILGYDTSGITAALDSDKPSNVTGISAAVMDDKLTLQWNASVDSGSGVAHYNIYRGTTPDFETTYRNMVGEALYNTFIDTENVESNKNYYYKIEAEDYCGNVSETPTLLFAGTYNNLPKIKTVDSTWTNSNGVLTAVVSEASLMDAVTALKNSDFTTIRIAEPETDNAADLKIKLPAQSVNMAQTAGIDKIDIETKLGTLLFSTDAFGNKLKKHSSDIELSVSLADKSKLPSTIGADNTVYDFNAYIDGKELREFEGKQGVKVSIDYKLKAGENPEKIVVYYINDNGKLEALKDCRYDAATGKATFNVTSLGMYFAKAETDLNR